MHDDIRRDEFHERNVVYGFVDTQLGESRRPTYEYTPEFIEGLKACLHITAFVMDKYIHKFVSKPHLDPLVP